MSARFLKRAYIDPFESEEITKVEIVEVEKINFFSKRRANKPNYEIHYKSFKFDVMASKLQSWQLNIFDYLQLLSEKPKEIQEKYHYEVTTMEPLEIQFGIVEKLERNDLTRATLMQEIFSKIGIPHTFENDSLLRSLIKDVDLERLKYENEQKFNSCIENPYIKTNESSVYN